ncbi:MAG: hypothetical protein Q9163_003480 [Psora crenata]
MAEESPDYKKLFFEEKQKTRKTTLPEFLDACHVHLHSALTVQTNAIFSTKGDPSNVKKKMCPERIVEWTNFPLLQEAIWNDLQRTDFMHERHFTSLHTLKESGDNIRKRMMSSELDLNHFERQTVEDHIASIIEQMYQNSTLRKTFGIKGSVKFENHSNTLKPELEEEMENLSLDGRRRSPRLLAQSANPPESSLLPDPTATETVGARKSAHPRADQFCVYNVSSEPQDSAHNIAAFIIEYKAPHKLNLGCIYEGLDNIELKEIIHRCENEGPRDRYRRLVAAVVIQAFSYMVQAGLEYGYVCTGEAFIFLRVPEDPKTVYYFLSVPGGDVGETTGLIPDLNGANRLHQTAVGQVLAFTLRALKTPPRTQTWRANAKAQLQTWEVVYNELLDQISKDNMPSSDYRPPRQKDFLRMSPIQLRRRVASNSSLGCPMPQHEGESSGDDFGSDPDTPSRPHRQPATQLRAPSSQPAAKNSSHQGSSRGGENVQYCTQKCLRGLLEGHLLDKTCPNAGEHGKRHHRIDGPTFIQLMRQQLTESLDTDVTQTGVHGATGALFQVRLTSHGYTVAAKATSDDFVAQLSHEALIYERLRPIQGIHVPVCLGNLDLAHPYFYEGIAELTHMMFLGYGGQPIYRHINANNRASLTQQVDAAFQAIHKLGVLHRDVMPRNILWNPKSSQLTIIDFERAKMEGPRAVLGAISLNRKRKPATKVKESPDDDVFVREERRALVELRGV